MARDIDYSGPYTRELRSEIRGSLDKLSNILSDTILQKEKSRAAKEMAQEVAIMNLMTQEFSSKRQEMFETRKGMIQKGIDLPPMDRTAGFQDFIALVDDVNNETIADMTEEIEGMEDKILNMYEADRSYIEGLKE